MIVHIATKNDSFSTDNTVEYAKKCGVEVYQHPFETHARQYKYAVKIADIKTKWILRIDADERLSYRNNAL